jgi:hypothetical protein
MPRCQAVWYFRPSAMLSITVIGSATTSRMKANTAPKGQLPARLELVVDGRRHHPESWSAGQDRGRTGVHAQDEHRHAAGHDR